MKSDINLPTFRRNLLVSSSGSVSKHSDIWNVCLPRNVIYSDIADLLAYGQ